MSTVYGIFYAVEIHVLIFQVHHVVSSGDTWTVHSSKTFEMYSLISLGSFCSRELTALNFLVVLHFPDHCLKQKFQVFYTPEILAFSYMDSA